MSKAVLPDFRGPERPGFDLGDSGLSCLVEMERLVWGVFLRFLWQVGRNGLPGREMRLEKGPPGYRAIVVSY